MKSRRNNLDDSFCLLLSDKKKREKMGKMILSSSHLSFFCCFSSLVSDRERIRILFSNHFVFPWSCFYSSFSTLHGGSSSLILNGPESEGYGKEERVVLSGNTDEVDFVLSLFSFSFRLNLFFIFFCGILPPDLMVVHSEREV